MRLRAALLAALRVLPAVAGAQVPVRTVADPETLFTDKDARLHANKKVALHMMRELLQCNHWKDADRWMSKDYVRHNPNLPTGREPVV